MSTVDQAVAEPPAGGPGSGGALLELRGVTKTFGPVRALSEVNFEIAAGQVTALVGDNGAGKS